MNCIIDQSPMRQLQIGDMNLEVCLQCKSVWLPSGQLQKMVTYLSAGVYDSAFVQWQHAQSDGKTVPQVFWQETTRMCPEDGTPMQKRYFAGNSGIGIDTCSSCNGFWIDGDEMAAIEVFTKPNEQLDVALSSLIAEDTAFAQEMEHMKKIPASLSSTALSTVSNPYYPVLLAAQHILVHIVQTLAVQDSQ